MYNLKEILNKLTSEKKVLIIGAAIVDIIINIEKLPHSGEDITAKSTKHTIGGCAFNVADVLNKLHLPFDLMIPIGNGDYSKIIYKSFKEKNYPIFKIEENIDNGYCISLVENDGERTFITMPGLELSMKEKWFEHIKINNYDYIYVSGYELEGKNGDILIKILQQKKASAKIIFDPGPRLNFINKNVINSIFHMNCIFTINNKEILSLVNENNIINAGKKLFNITKEPVIITNDNKGAILITNDVTIIDGFKVQVKDTIGAGDSHTGGILAGLSCNLNLKDSIYLANKIASIVVSKEGAATAPSLEELF